MLPAWELIPNKYFDILTFRLCVKKIKSWLRARRPMSFSQVHRAEEHTHTSRMTTVGRINILCFVFAPLKQTILCTYFARSWGQNVITHETDARKHDATTSETVSRLTCLSSSETVCFRSLVRSTSCRFSSLRRRSRSWISAASRTRAASLASSRAPTERILAGVFRDR